MISRRRILSAKTNNSSAMASWLPIVSKWNRSDTSLSDRTTFEKSSSRKRLTHSRICKTFTEWTTRQISSLYCLLQRDLTDDQSNNASTFLNRMNSKKNVTQRWCTERNSLFRWNFTIPIELLSKRRELDKWLDRIDASVQIVSDPDQSLHSLASEWQSTNACCSTHCNCIESTRSKHQSSEENSTKISFKQTARLIIRLVLIKKS